MRRLPVVRLGVAALAVAACLAVSAPAPGQSDARKPPPAAQDPAKKDGTSSAPRAARPDPRAQPRETMRGDERIRLDAPISFPVDI